MAAEVPTFKLVLVGDGGTGKVCLLDAISTEPGSDEASDRLAVCLIGSLRRT